MKLPFPGLHDLQQIRELSYKQKVDNRNEETATKSNVEEAPVEIFKDEAYEEEEAPLQALPEEARLCNAEEKKNLARQWWWLPYQVIKWEQAAFFTSLQFKVTLEQDASREEDFIPFLQFFSRGLKRRHRQQQKRLQLQGASYATIGKMPAAPVAISEKMRTKMTERARNVFVQLQDHPNPTMRSLMDYDPSFQRPLSKNWLTDDDDD